MSVNSLKDFSRVIAELENGQLNADLSQKLETALKALKERCDIDGIKSAGAKIAVELSIVYEGDNIEINARTKSTLPEKPRNRSIFWLSEDGKGVWRENPKQPRLPFDVVQGKREVVDYDEERKDING